MIIVSSFIYWCTCDAARNCWLIVRTIAHVRSYVSDGWFTWRELESFKFIFHDQWQYYFERKLLFVSIVVVSGEDISLSLSLSIHSLSSITYAFMEELIQIFLVSHHLPVSLYGRQTVPVVFIHTYLMLHVSIPSSRKSCVAFDIYSIHLCTIRPSSA